MLRSELGVFTCALLLLLHAFLVSHALAADEVTTTEFDLEEVTTLTPEVAQRSQFETADDAFFYGPEETKSANRTGFWWRQSFLPIRQRNRRCVCEDFTCGCCAGMALQRINISQIGCMNFTYDPDQFAINMKLLMNERTMMERSVSGRNPPPMCIPLPSPFSFIPRFDFCAKLFNVFTPGRNLHACLEWSTKVNSNPVLEVQFDCFRMGADGFAVLKPDAGGGLGPSQVSPGGGGSDVDLGGGGGGGGGSVGVGEDYDPLDPEEPDANKRKPGRRPVKKKPKNVDFDDYL